MKRLMLVLLVVVCMLMVVAPASATTLTGRFMEGTAYGAPAPGGMTLAPSGAVNIVIGTTHEVSGALRVTAPADPTQGPFPFTLPLRNFFTWTRGTWVGGTYIAVGTVGTGTPEDPRFDATLTAGHGAFTMRVQITNSFYQWDHWIFSGVLL